MTLTDKKIKGLQPKDKPYKVSDSGSLFVHVQPGGSKYWRMNYRILGKTKTLAIGVYPEIGLKDARNTRDDAKRMLRNGLDPSEEKQKLRRKCCELTQPTFEQAAQEWMEVKSHSWRPSHIKKQNGLLTKNLLPPLGNIPIRNINPQVVLSALRLVEERGAYETTRRCKQIASQIFYYAIAVGYLELNPTSGLGDALIKPKTKHFPAIIDKQEFGQLMRAIHGFEGSVTVEIALKLAPLLFVRPGELRHMEWAELNFDKELWSIPASKMKMAEPHIIPLSHQAIALIRKIEPISGRWKYVFSGERSHQRPMSENALNAALRRLGYTKSQHTTHGFRASARTLLDEELGFPPHIIEQQLAHNVKDPLGRAYNRTKHLSKRQEMMQSWADFIDQARDGATIVKLSECHVNA